MILRYNEFYFNKFNKGIKIKPGVNIKDKYTNLMASLKGEDYDLYEFCVVGDELYLTINYVVVDIDAEIIKLTNNYLDNEINSEKFLNTMKQHVKANDYFKKFIY